MSLTPEDVDHIALLARLHLSPEEKERYRRQLSDILKHVDKLSELDTSQVEPMSSVAVPQSRLRPDQPGDGMPRPDLLRNAPDTEDNQFRVPPVLDGGP